MDEGDRINMISTKIAYDGARLYFNPYTVSYILDQDDTTVIGFTNGHTYDVTASGTELRRLIDEETKSLCKECKASLQE